MTVHRVIPGLNLAQCSDSAESAGIRCDFNLRTFTARTSRCELHTDIGYKRGTNKLRANVRANFSSRLSVHDKNRRQLNTTPS